MGRCQHLAQAKTDRGFAVTSPWLDIVGFGEGGVEALTPPARAALEAAEVVMAPPRHLARCPETVAQRIEWPAPFAEGVATLMEMRGIKSVAVLASGNPFWFGAGSTLVRDLEPSEWRAHPGPSTFSLAAARLGWPMEFTVCLGLHAAPLTRARRHLARGARLLVLLRNGDAVIEFAQWLTETGFGASELNVMEALGGPRERITPGRADSMDGQFFHPVCVAVRVWGDDGGLSLTPGRASALFENDGQITKAPIRALTLSALAPRPGERLWDIGAGSGAISVEWLLGHPGLAATAFERDPERAARIRRNAARFGVDRFELVEGAAPEALDGAEPPDAVFVGGGLSKPLFESVRRLTHKGTRLVANAVTLETEALLTDLHQEHGGSLLRLDVAEAMPLGPRRGWQPSRPVTQWSVTL